MFSGSIIKYIYMPCIFFYFGSNINKHPIKYLQNSPESSSLISRGTHTCCHVPRLTGGPHRMKKAFGRYILVHVQSRDDRGTDVIYSSSGVPRSQRILRRFRQGDSASPSGVYLFSLLPSLPRPHAIEKKKSSGRSRSS